MQTIELSKQKTSNTKSKTNKRKAVNLDYAELRCKSEYLKSPLLHAKSKDLQYTLG